MRNKFIFVLCITFLLLPSRSFGLEASDIEGWWNSTDDNISFSVGETRINFIRANLSCQPTDIFTGWYDYPDENTIEAKWSSHGSWHKITFTSSCKSTGYWKHSNCYGGETTSYFTAYKGDACCPETEVCDGLDNDCDGQIDEGLEQSTYYQDGDADNYGDASDSTQSCSQPSGYVSDNTDCDDSNPAINPGATETCNGLDDNCDGQIDEEAQTDFYQDSDNDGYGNPDQSENTCPAPVGYVADNTDCNDNSAAINPGANESCNGIDDNCNDQIDDGLTYITYYLDSDGDGYGNSSGSTTVCSGPPSGYVSDNTDCNDGDSLINPAATEICDDGIDNNCDGQIDEGGCQCPTSLSRDDFTDISIIASNIAGITNPEEETIYYHYPYDGNDFRLNYMSPICSGRTFSLTSNALNLKETAFLMLTPDCWNGKFYVDYRPFIESEIITREFSLTEAKEGDYEHDVAYNRQKGELSIFISNGSHTVANETHLVNPFSLDMDNLVVISPLPLESNQEIDDSENDFPDIEITSVCDDPDPGGGDGGDGDDDDDDSAKEWYDCSVGAGNRHFTISDLVNLLILFLPLAIIRSRMKSI